MRRLLIGFPGQGSQKLLQGKDLAVAYPASAGLVFGLVNTALDNLFTDLGWAEGEKKQEELNLTKNAQPVVLTTSVACLAALDGVHRFKISPANTACLVGHSLGEFTCLVAAGSLTLEDAAQLVRRRGEVMQQATNDWGKKPALAALLGLKWEQGKEIEKACPPNLFVQAANQNGPEQTLMSGCEEGVAWAVEQAKSKYGVRRAMKIPTSCPFHTTVMQGAADAFRKDLHRVNLEKPSVPIIFNVDASVKVDPNEIREALLKGMYSPVLWGDCITNAVKQFGDLEFREIGGDKLKFGMSNGPNLTFGKPVRPIPEDIKSFSL